MQAFLLKSKLLFAFSLDVIHLVFPHPYSLKSVILLLDEQLSETQADVIDNLPEVLRACLPVDYDLFNSFVMKKSELT